MATTLAQQKAKEKAARKAARDAKKLARSKAKTKHYDDVAKVADYAQRNGYSVIVLNKKSKR